MSFRASLLPCAGKAGGSVPPLTAAGHLSVVVSCQTPSGSYRFHAATWSTPAQPYEDLRCAGALRAMGWLLRAQFKSQFTDARCGQTACLHREIGADRTRVGSGRALSFITARPSPGKANPVRINSCGVLRHWSNALLYVCQDAKRGITKYRPVLFVCVLHAVNKARRAQREAQRIIANGAQNHE